ncbi:hypothetical protein KKH46_01090 [Patescibacteria group bacterium]|nr:hypothetical protein [Patescibacteria group bacterium]MBU1730272.1 hypothetical protein [Patescibacteria group bacterium]MBU1956647.1 hypothetical protein [Patescibacteria group bacterium]MBU2010210.1 hypothetical protein [Patescibacteria group bacterium]
MMIFERFLRNSKKDEVVAILDIGSGSVGGALVSYPINKKPKILHSVRVPISFYDNFNFERFLKATLFATEKVLQALNSESVETDKPKQIFYILATPWCVSQSRTAVFEDLNTFFTTHKKVDQIITNEVKSLKIKTNALYKNFTSNNMETIEIENIKTKLNGYETNAPYGKKISKLEADLYISMSTCEILQSFRQITKRIFEMNQIFFNSFSLAAFIVMRDLYSEKQNFIFVDMGGEATEIFITHNGILTDTFSISLGKNFLLRTMTSEMQTTKEETLSLFGLFMEGNLTATKKQKVQKALEYVAAEWNEAFCKEIQSRSECRILPRLFFVAADTPFAQWLTTTIKNNKLKDILKQPIEVALINPLIFNKFVAVDIKTKSDIFMTVGTLFVDRLIKSKS